MEIGDCNGGERGKEQDWVMGKEERQMYTFLMYRSHIYPYMIYVWKENFGESRCIMECAEETSMSKAQLHMVIGMS